jgi:hypothetical protein
LIQESNTSIAPVSAHVTTRPDFEMRNDAKKKKKDEGLDFPFGR